MAGVALPANFEWGFAGDVELMQESAAAMGLALLLAVAFIYIVLASQFESFLEPLLIMLSLPLAIVGALLAILLTGNNLGMPAMIGMVMLMGLVTKNAILLIDLTNQYVREGLSVEDAILKAGPIRLRPILMTTMAMILGMLPSAMGRGEGGEFRAPISIATIGGLITSTALTLVVVPVAYLLLARILARMQAWRSQPASRLAPAARIAGVLLVLALVGWFLAASLRADASSPIPGRAGRASAECPEFDVRPGARTRDWRQSGAEGGPGARPRESGQGLGGQDQLPARGELQLLVHAVAAVSADSDSTWHLRARRDDLPGELPAREHPGARHLAAALHRRTAP